MRLVEHYTEKGYKCGGCNYTAYRWYAFDCDEKFDVEDERPTWCCMDCMIEYIVNHCEVTGL